MGRVRFLSLGRAGRHLISRSRFHICPSIWVGLGAILLGACGGDSAGSKGRLCRSCNSCVWVLGRSTRTAADTGKDSNKDQNDEGSWNRYS